MIRSVTVTNHVGETLVLDLANPEQSGLAIVNITGIGPITGTINIANWASYDGGRFNSARAGTRNILMTLRYLGSPTMSIEEARHKTYRFFVPKKKIKLSFKTDSRTVWIEGYVERNEPNIFTQRSGCSISVLCPNPYFIKAKDNAYEGSITFSGIENMFEIPGETFDDTSNGWFNNTNTPNIEIARILSNSSKVITYDGDTDGGFTLTLEATGNVVNPILYNATSGDAIRIETTMESGDVITYSTVPGEKYIRLQKDGVESNIIGKLSRPISWMRLIPGDNSVAYTAESGDEYMRISMQFDILIGGV